MRGNGRINAGEESRRIGEEKVKGVEGVGSNKSRGGLLSELRGVTGERKNNQSEPLQIHLTTCASPSVLEVK